MWPLYPSGKIKFLFDWITILGLLLLVAVQYHLANDFNLKECDYPLGMESGKIPDSALTASSFYVPNVGPKNGRLNNEKAGGAWCPKSQITPYIIEYLEINLETTHALTAIQTQGRYDHGRGQEYTEEFRIEYWRERIGKWRRYKMKTTDKEIISGNSDTSTIETHKLFPYILADKIRVVPISPHPRTVCLRVEIFGCPFTRNIISYKMPSCSCWNEDYPVNDLSYDGDYNEGYLENGLGQLVDSLRGNDNPRMDLAYGLGNGWVGWRNDSSNDSFVELEFEFTEIKNFSKVHLFTNNNFKYGVQVFCSARILFSIGGKYFNSRPIVYNYQPDNVSESARTVTIHLDYNVGKYVKMQLFFCDSWIMISEVDFETDILEDSGNYTVEDKDEPAAGEIYVESYGVVDPPWEPPQSGLAGSTEYIYNAIITLTGTSSFMMLLFCGMIFVNYKHNIHRTIRSVFIKQSEEEEETPENDVVESPPEAPAVDLTINPVHSYFHERKENELETVMENSEDAEQPSCGRNTYCELETPKDADSSIRTNHGRTTTLKIWKHQNRKPRAFSVDSSTSEDEDTTTRNAKKPMRLKHDKRVCSFGTYKSIRQTENPEAEELPPPSPVRETASDLESRNQRQILFDTNHQAVYFSASLSEEVIEHYSVLLWNICPTMGHPFKDTEEEIDTLPLNSFRILNKFGGCHFGEIYYCEPKETDCITNGRYVARISKGDVFKEARLMSTLNHSNLIKTYGIYNSERPPWLIMEYITEYGDLVNYLQNYGISTSSGLLTNFCFQISTAMKYLESKHMLHKDLAARNCYLNNDLTVKIGDFAICNSSYRRHYVRIHGSEPLPIRWLPWESILLKQYTCASSVWSFGVTLWEIFNFCKEVPFSHLTDSQIIQQTESYYYGRLVEFAGLPKPALCCKELYELMCNCWERDDCMRPTFKKIYSILKAKNKCNKSSTSRFRR